MARDRNVTNGDPIEQERSIDQGRIDSVYQQLDLAKAANRARFQQPITQRPWHVDVVISNRSDPFN